MLGNPSRQDPGRGHNRPGVRRDPRPVNRLSVAEQHTDKPDQDKGSSAKAHAEARSRVISTLALGITHRVIAVVAVIAVLAISFVSSFSVYMRQQHQIALAQQQIAEREEAVADLQDQIARWKDPDYVRAQARDRLGWVMPGEVGYRVIDADGTVIGGLSSTESGVENTDAGIWYEVMWGSVKAADQPVPTSAESTPPPDVIIGPTDEATPR